MGSLCSACCGNQDDDIFENEETDKTNLLGNPVGESSSQSISNKHSTPNVTDQQAKLNQILQKTANSYIDVPALNSPVDQPTEKTKVYEGKVQAALKKRPCTERTSLLEDNPHLERTLSEEPLLESDKKMVKEANSLIVAALQCIQVENTENLVIPFNTPKDQK
ncbi:uncharacterized protein LOC118192745 isoform X2 [Stegodyphus dumicola]|uniref:uncharacterized protein LOC118192745 isoform X2 n=1 Tax=Stegodyphus dumicola TaxID=202533 RepID=UPI0015AA79B7|nr:uncharacterized protein LOC118192745 isoform X2 [Stegodyphus dumicola]